jgi:hypothetical protein
MYKKVFCLVLGLGLATRVFADLGFFVSFNSNESLKVFTSDYISGPKIAPSFWDTLFVLSSFESNRQEFNVFCNIIKGEHVPIEAGQWNTKKFAMGMSIGKVFTIPISLPKIDAEFKLDFSAGPFFYLFLTNQFIFVSGKRQPKVEDANIINRIQHGLYSAVRLRWVHFKNYFNQADFNLGFHFFMPFSNHEFNSDPKARYHLFKTFAFVGISF